MNAKRSNRRIGNFESMEERKLFAADLGFDLAAPAPDTQAAIQVSLRSEAVDLAVDGYEEGSERSDDKEWHDTKPMGWDNTVHKKWTDGGISVDREMIESGEKGSTEYINIGVGELQECTISKSMDTASMSLAQFAINGNSPGTAEIDFVEVGGGGDAVPSANEGLRGLLLPAVQQAHADAPGHNVGLMSIGGDLEVGQLNVQRPASACSDTSPELNRSETQSIAATDVIFETDNDVELFLLTGDTRDMVENGTVEGANEIVLNTVYNANGPIRVMAGGAVTGIFLRTDVESL